MISFVNLFVLCCRTNDLVSAAAGILTKLKGVRESAGRPGRITGIPGAQISAPKDGPKDLLRVEVLPPLLRLGSPTPLRKEVIVKKTGTSTGQALILNMFY